MGNFDSLTWAFSDWFDAALEDLPPPLRKRAGEDFCPHTWDSLKADQRRSLALQLDYQHDPATEQDQQYWFDFFEQERAIKNQIEEWVLIATPTASDLALKEARLTDLRQKLGRMDIQKRQERGDYYPERPDINTKGKSPPSSLTPIIQYVAYPKAMHQLAERLGATPEELAAWVWTGQKDGGITAYLNANELDPPPRFYFATGSESQDYIAPLMACWFRADEIATFVPTERYITGLALMERWGKYPGLQTVAFIRAKIAESRLQDVHPIYGGTQGTFAEHSYFPPLASGLFALSQIEQIEVEDFPEKTEAPESVNSTSVCVPNQSPAVGSSEWFKETARAAANLKHDLPGGSRDKQRQIRELWASGKYSTRDLCAEQECAALGMSFKAARKALFNTPAPPRC